MVIYDKDIKTTLIHGSGKGKVIEFKFHDKALQELSPDLIGPKFMKCKGYYTFIYMPKNSKHFFFFRNSFMRIYDPRKKSVTFDYSHENFINIEATKMNFLKYKFLTLL